MKKRLFDILKPLAYAKIGIASIAFAFYLGAKSHNVVRRIEDSILYSNVPAAEQSFADPAGLEILIEINPSGRKDVYLYHPESGKKIAIGYDMLPKKAEDLAKGLEARLYRN